MIVIENRSARSDAGKFVRKKGTDICGTQIFVRSESVDDFEELDTLPAVVDESGYGERVNALIRERYSLSEELALLRQRDTKADDFAAYDAYCEQCKSRAKAELLTDQTTTDSHDEG